MKFIGSPLTWVTWLALGCLAAPAASSGVDTPGRALAQRVYDRPDGRDVVTDGRMVLLEKGYAPRERRMFVYTRDTDAGDFWSLIRFTLPAKIRDTGLLSVDLVDGTERQYLYLPALKRVRRISSNRQGGRFVSSDLYYEDLQDRKVPEDHHQIRGHDTAGGKPCTVLESVPVDPGNSTYSKRVSCIDEETLIPLRVEFFEDNAEAPSKRFEVDVAKIRQVQGYWTIMDSTMTDLKSGHRTRTVIDAIRYDQDLPDALFSRRALEDATREERFRPGP